MLPAEESPCREDGAARYRIGLNAFTPDSESLLQPCRLLGLIPWKGIRPVPRNYFPCVTTRYLYFCTVARTSS